MTKEQFKKELIAEAKAYNKYLTNEYLNSLEVHTLIAYSHPISRIRHFDTLKKLKG